MGRFVFSKNVPYQIFLDIWKSSEYASDNKFSFLPLFPNFVCDIFYMKL